MAPNSRSSRPRPAQRAHRLEAAEAPATRLSPGLVALCTTGERAVTVIAGPGRSVVAALGSPGEPEAFSVWRTQGVYVFCSGDLPQELDLELGRGARVVATARYA